MKKKLLIAVIAVAALLSLGGCSSREAVGTTTDDAYIERTDGTYVKAQIIIPDNYEDEKLPLVTVGHGFHGSMNSAGAADLSENMAQNGLATIRMDYSHYIDENSDEQTDQYTVNTMIEDQLLCVEYMIENYNIDEDRIGLYSRSLGGRVAMTMANENKGNYDYKALAVVAPAGTYEAFHYYMGGEEKWKEFYNEAKAKGSVTHQGVVLTPEFFEEMDAYVPSETAYKYERPVLVIYNTLDKVVTAETSLECACGYENAQTMEVTTEGGHGYEMNYEKSDLKDKLINKLTEFFKDNL